MVLKNFASKWMSGVFYMLYDCKFFGLKNRTKSHGDYHGEFI